MLGQRAPRTPRALPAPAPAPTQAPPRPSLRKSSTHCLNPMTVLLSSPSLRHSASCPVTHPSPPRPAARSCPGPTASSLGPALPPLPQAPGALKPSNPGKWGAALARVRALPPPPPAGVRSRLRPLRPLPPTFFKAVFQSDFLKLLCPRQISILQLTLPWEREASCHLPMALQLPLAFP